MQRGEGKKDNEKDIVSFQVLKCGGMLNNKQINNKNV